MPCTLLFRAISRVELFLDSSDMSREEFIAHTTFMNKVNAIFESHKFGNEEPRPPLAHVQVAPYFHQQIVKILFDEDGSLKNGIVKDLDLSVENDPRYIDFGNTIDNGRKDRRYQVGLKKQMGGTYGASHRNEGCWFSWLY